MFTHSLSSLVLHNGQVHLHDVIASALDRERRAAGFPVALQDVVCPCHISTDCARDLSPHADPVHESETRNCRLARFCGWRLGQTEPSRLILGR
jgi:hypothetical protein